MTTAKWNRQSAIYLWKMVTSCTLISDACLFSVLTSLHYLLADIRSCTSMVETYFFLNMNSPLYFLLGMLNYFNHIYSDLCLCCVYPILLIRVTVDYFMWMYAVKTCIWSMFVQNCSLFVIFDCYSCWSIHSCRIGML